MSEKLITMKEYNGTSYDDLYPKNTSGQVYLDSTAQSVLNLPSGKTVNDALDNLANGGAFKVGDILVTSRTDLDDSWLLCNGNTLNPNEYSDLATVLPLLKTGDWLTDGSFATPSNYTLGHSLVKIGDKWGICSTTSSGSSKIQFNIFILNDLMGTTLSDTGLTTQSSGISALVVSSINDGKSCYMKRGLAFTNLFTSPKIIATYNGVITYGDNTYWFGDWYSTQEDWPYGPQVKKKASLEDDNFIKVAQIGNSSYITYITFVNGNIIVRDETTSSDTDYLTLVNTDGTYSHINFPNITATPSNVTIQYLNGYYYGFGGTIIYRRESLTSGDWVAWKTMPNNTDTGYSYMGDNVILLTSGYSITANGDLVEWKDKPSFTNEIYTDKTNGIYVSQIGTSNQYMYTPMTSQIKLPTWTPADGLYAYIKAKN